MHFPNLNIAATEASITGYGVIFFDTKTHIYGIVWIEDTKILVRGLIWNF